MRSGIIIALCVLLATIATDAKQVQHKEKSYGVNSKLTESNFYKEVLASRQPWMVEFFAPWCGHCQTLAPQWERAAKSLKNMVRFGAVDATVDSSLASQFKVSGYPTIIMLPAGKKTPQKITKYEGARTAKALEDYALTLLHDKHVIKLSDEETVIKFVSAPKPKVLVFTEKKLTPDLIKSLSIAYDTNITFGVVRGNRQHSDLWIKRFDVTSLPAVIVLQAYTADQAAATILGHQYDGATFYDDLFEDIWPLLNPGSIPANDRTYYLTDAARSSSPATTSESHENINQGVVHEPRSEDQWNESCQLSGGTCLIAFLDLHDHHYDLTLQELADGRVSVNAVASKLKQFHIVRLMRNDPAIVSLMNTIGVATDGPISIISYHPKRKRMAQYMGSVTLESLMEFMVGVQSGSIKTVPVEMAIDWKQFEPMNPVNRRQRAIATNPDNGNEHQHTEL